MHLIISLKEDGGGGDGGDQPATHGMLQKEINNGFKKPAKQNAK